MQPVLPSAQVDCHSEGIDFNEFIAAMIDSQDLADQQANLFTMVRYSRNRGPADVKCLHRLAAKTNLPYTNCSC